MCCRNAEAEQFWKQARRAARPSLERSLAGEVGKPAKAAAVRCGSKGRPAGPAPAAKTGREGAIANVARRIFRI